MLHPDSRAYLALARYGEIIVDLTQKSDAEILAVVDPIMDNLMDASTAVDYERHIRDFTDRAKSVMPKERLESICKEYQSTKDQSRLMACRARYRNL